MDERALRGLILRPLRGDILHRRGGKRVVQLPRAACRKRLMLVYQRVFRRAGGQLFEMAVIAVARALGRC